MAKLIQSQITPNEIKAYYDEARSEDFHYKTRMKTNYDMYRFRHWPAHTGETGKFPDWMSDIVLPRIYEYVEVALALLTDNLPVLDSKPIGRMDTRKSALMNEHLKLWQLKSRLRWFLSLMIKDLLINGAGIMLARWDKDRKDVRNEILDPFKVFLDPEATSFDLCSADYIIYREVRNKPYMEKHYPDAVHLLNFNLKDRLGDKLLVEPNRGPTHTETLPDYKSEGGGGAAEPDSALITDRKKQVVVYECSYDGGRRRAIMGEDHILQDEAEEIVREDVEHNFPMAFFACYAQPHEIWPMGVPEALEQMQYELNKGVADSINWSNKMGTPDRIVPQDKGITEEDLQKNELGRTLRPDSPQTAAAIRYEYPPDRAPHEKERHAIVSQEMDKTAGMGPQSFGQKPDAAQPSGRAILALQQATHTKLGLIIRNIEDGLRVYADKVVVLFQHHYDAKQHERLMDIYDELYPSNGIDYKIEASRIWKGINAQNLLGGEWDIKVDVESALPQSKIARAEQAMHLFTIGTIDRQELLETLEWPGREELMRRLGNMAMPPSQPQGIPLGGQPEGVTAQEEAGMEGA